MKGKLKQTTAGLLLFVMVFTAVFGTGAIEAKAASYGLVNNEVVYFGNYIQEDTNGDGTVDGWDEPQPIKWRVLIDGNWKVLISDKILDVGQYHNKKVISLKWAESDIRQWLNDEFYNEAFTKAEQQRLLDFEYSYIKTVNGEEIETKYKDKVQLLSKTDMECKYSSSFKNSDARRAEPTDYAAQRGRFLDVGYYVSDLRLYYWLLTEFTYESADVCNGGFSSYVVTSSGLGIRPVIKLNNATVSDGNSNSGGTSGGTSSSNSSSGIDDPLFQQLLQEVMQSIKEAQDAINKQLEDGSTSDKNNNADAQQSTKSLNETKDAAPAVVKSLKAVNKKKGKTVVTFKKVSKATGYEIQYAKNKKFTKGKVKKTTKKTSYTIKNLSKKKTYYFRVRAYKKLNGKTYYGKWSSVKALKVKR